MKRMIVILTLTMLSALAALPLMAAGIPATINLQGRLTDGAGSNLPDGAYSVLFRIYDDPVAGAELWSETLPVQLTGGLFTVTVGDSTAIPADIFSDAANRYLGVTVNPEPEMPRIPLNSVAYAYQTQNADVATLALDLTCVGCVSAADIAPNAVGASEIAEGAVVGGFHGDIADETITAEDLAHGSVESSEIAGGAVSAGEVLNGSLFAVEFGDEPGVAGNINSGDIAFDLNGTSYQTLLSRSIVPPAGGYILAIATARVNMIQSGSLFNTGPSAWFGVSTTASDLPSSQNMLVDLPQLGPNGETQSQVVTVHGLFSTTGGADTLFFLGYEIGAEVEVYDRQLTLIYFPTAYGTVVSTAAASGGEVLSYQAAETGSVLPEVVSGPGQAQVNADMELRIQKLEERLRQIGAGTEEK